MRRVLRVASAAAALLGVLTAVSACGRTPPRGAVMAFQVEGAYAPWRYVALRVTDSGAAVLEWERYGSGRETVSFTVPEDEVRQLYARYRAARFLQLSPDKVEAPEAPTDTGTTTLSLTRGGSTRSLSYRYTENQALRELAERFMQLALPRLPRPQG